MMLCEGWRRWTLSLVVVLLMNITQVRGAEAAAKVEDIGSEKQLWLDERLMDQERSHGVTRRMNPPLRIERVMTPDAPWEALGFIFYSSVVEAKDGFLLYYGSYDAEKKKHFCVATSEDGLHWVRPKLGLREFGGSKDNNILAVDAVEACVINDADQQKPDLHYRLFYTRHWPDPQRAGVYTATSADGIHWNEMEQRMLPFVPDSQPSAYWDDERKEYAIFLRAWDKKRFVARVGVKHVEDPWPWDAQGPPFMVWGPNKIPTLSHELPIVMGPDEKDPPSLELYTSGCLKLGDDGTRHAYLAFPAAFTLYKGPEWEPRALPKTSDGSFDVQLAVSRDGVQWERFREPYISTGRLDGLDLRLVSMGVGMVHPRARRPDDWPCLQYFVGWPYTHGQPVVWDRDVKEREKWMKQDRGGIYCAMQRCDGFVSMDAGNEEGVLVTKPVKFKGSKLFLSFKTAGIGSVKVALLDEAGQPFEGFDKEDCELINGDELQHEVKRKGKGGVSPLQGVTMRLQFTMRNAKVFAWQFAPPATD